MGVALFSSIRTVADSGDVDLRKQASRFKFCAAVARKNCSRTCLILHKTLCSPMWFFYSARVLLLSGVGIALPQNRNGRQLSCPFVVPLRGDGFQCAGKISVPLTIESRASHVGGDKVWEWTKSKKGLQLLFC